MVGLVLAGVVSPTHAMVINATYTPRFMALPQATGLERAFGEAAAAFTSTFRNPITINVTVDWGFVAGTTLPASAVGASTEPVYGAYTYSAIRSALAAAASSNTDRLAVASLPVTAPAGQSRYVVPSAEAKALRLIPADSPGMDGYIGFAGAASSFSFAAGNPVQVASSQYDFTGIAEHELAEILGRTSGANYAVLPWRTPLDLFRCSGGTLSLSYTATATFSIDGCRTSLATFNTVGAGDRSDWASRPGSTDSSDAFVGRGEYRSVSPVDQLALDVIGYDALGAVGGTGSTATVLARSGGHATDALDVSAPGGLLSAAGGLGVLLASRRRLGQGFAKAVAA